MKIVITSIIVILSTAFVLWNMYLFDDVVTQGDAYGFSIGMKKNEALVVIYEKYNSIDNRIVLSRKTFGDDVRNIKHIGANEISNNVVLGMNVWQIRFDGKETNVLILFFSNGELERMMRYRRLFIK